MLSESMITTYVILDNMVFIMHDHVIPNNVIVVTHCLLKAVVTLVTGTWGLKAILLENEGYEDASMCNEEE